MSNPVKPVTETDLKTNCDTGLEIIGTLDYARRGRSNFSHDDDHGVSVVGGGSLSLSLSLSFLPVSLAFTLFLMMMFVLSVWSAEVGQCHQYVIINQGQIVPQLTLF